MRIIECEQQSEEWDRLRARPTASEFGKFITAVRGDFSKQATGYARKIVAKKLGVYVEPFPSAAMERGTELESSAKLAYTKMTGREIQNVGFVVPDNTDAYGGSPDGLVGDDGIIEIKCPLAETHIGYCDEGTLPSDHRPQVQALLFITGREWLDFFSFHPELTPFLLRVEPDLKYHAKMAAALLLLLKEIERIESKVTRQHHQIIPTGSDGFDGAEVYDGN